MNYEAVVIGVSAGGMQALKFIFSNLSNNFTIPVIVVQHLHSHSDGFLTHHLNENSSLHIKEAEEKEMIKPSTVYIAPPNYHLMIEDDKTLSLSIEARVNYCRPSIDILFESAVDVYGSKLIGIILTGANDDGAKGMKKIKTHGGLTVIQDPATAEVGIMPLAVLKHTKVDHVFKLEEIVKFLEKLNKT